MLLTYSYKDQMHKVYIHWTADTGYSTVFREIVQRISDKHHFDPSDYQGLAIDLDGLADKLYDQLNTFLDEHSGVPYNPSFRRAVLRAFSEINDKVTEHPIPGDSDFENLVVLLFKDVSDKLGKTVDVYLDDHAYQCKFRERLRNKEEYLETTAQIPITNEFESTLLQMTDLSRVMDCLSDIQRGRLVKHIFLKYTLQEIADNEHTSKQAVQDSITAALNKIRLRIH